jgi:tetratricopeptide (TPR) repeat protein
MAEPRRVPSSPLQERTADRASQADVLLGQGLECYFDGRFEDAIHIWTRVLFLDRSHARARAYIDRARSALAEGQRKSEEMLQASQQFLDRGQTDAARQLLTEAVASTGDDERASALRIRLEWLERARAVSPAAGLPISAAGEVVPAWAWPNRSFRIRSLLGLAGVALLVLIVTTGVRDLVGAPRDAQRLPPPAPVVPMQVLSSSEVALIRARTLYGRGRLAQALQALDRVDDRDAIRREADLLRIEIQQLLLATAPAVGSLSGEVLR